LGVQINDFAQRNRQRKADLICDLAQCSSDAQFSGKKSIDSIQKQAFYDGHFDSKNKVRFAASKKLLAKTLQIRFYTVSKKT